MFGSVDKSKGYLFCTYDLAQGMRNAIEAMRKEVDTLEANRLLNTAPEDLKAYFAQKYGITPLRLLRENWYATPSETKVDVRYDPLRWIDDKSQPVLVPGERIEVRVPFEGEAQLFYNGNTMTTSPPRAVIDGNELVLAYEMPFDAPRDIMPLVERALADIEQYLGWQRSMIDAHNQQLTVEAEAAIRGRRQRLLAQSQRVAALGIPIKKREDAPKTYAIPTARKKAPPALPPASSAPFAPEPTWAMEHYEHALKIMQDMALVMERSPQAFKSMDEEAIRQHFLVQLNGQFEGRATGETFNMSGKTDIILREGERNVFIAECKFWKGPKVFGEAIDQLLKYATWRDSKTVILVFNRGTETSTVLKGVDATAKEHANYKRVASWPHESGFRYVFHANGDTNRELIVTVLVFHVPE
jgi:hypothetical protein